ncbi:MAG: arabinofuranosidase [Bacteroidetes bacterium]|uniref:non-reducing end alpha-L-arabinofuranosidase family hydrolase n=1 Tax=Chitinophaga sp. LS1 TaxID=3051176 RepID=UPI001D5D5754|nr:non-reducing end alpha-L-arabinofuranosidase family hydrolase [Chitinophaga sp. LS1]MBP1650351.1 arabinofuranosidase [Bacteroidota bacterium]WPV65643.1 non-reducing end alpha-L-arabinofuranosidase family hydrolase [Chitinophaga sp. LS1]
MKQLQYIAAVVTCLLLCASCTKKSLDGAGGVTDKNRVAATATAIANPTWYADARCFLDGPAGAFDDLAVKDPSIVYSGGKYHLFYTGRDKGTGGLWRMGYAAATSIAGLKTASRTYMSALNAGSYFCAPQVFWFPAKGKWFLIYQSGQGASFSTSTDVGNPGSWTPVSSMGFTDGIDFWCISDGTYMYCFYSAQDGSRTIKRRRTTVANFPYNWEAPTVAATSTFEAVHVYKSKADAKYYMIVEDINRYQELWTASSLGGTWTQVAEKWAARDNLRFLSEVWTDQVSHVEVIRSGTDDKLEIDNIDRCQLLIQGVPNGSYGDYGNIPYDLGVIRNYQ